MVWNFQHAMFLREIFLENFRNHRATCLEFSKKKTILTGANGAGKTAILEGIFALALCKPFRSSHKKVFVKSGETFARVRGQVESESGKQALEIFWKKNPNRTVLKVGDSPTGTREFLQRKKFFAVLFCPESLQIVAGPPAGRRKFLAENLLPVSDDFFQESFRLEKILKNRNALLQAFARGQAGKSEFAFWDRQLVQASAQVTQMRDDLIDFFNARVGQHFQAISGTAEKLQLKFCPSTQDLAGDLAKNFKRETILGTTEKGAHRDDFEIFLDGEKIAHTGSRGQVRSCLLALKFCQRDFLHERTGQSPVLLLDDVFSELDLNHRQCLLRSFDSSQVILSATERPSKLGHGFQVVRVQEGQVQGSR